MITYVWALGKRLLALLFPQKQKLAAPDDRELRQFVDYFGFRPAALDENATHEQIQHDIMRIKERIAQYIELAAQAIKKYYRAASSPGCTKDRDALHRKADDLYNAVADACLIAHRFYPEAIPERPEEIQMIFVEFPISHSYINFFLGWGFDIRKRS